jgi:uncharacterized membrane protein YjdF
MVLTTIFILFQVITLIGLASNAKYIYIHDVVITSIFILIFNCIKKRYKVRVNNYIYAITLLSIVSHTFLGEWLGLYIKSNFFDRIQHIFGTYALTLYIYSFINERLGKTYTPSRELIDILALGIALGAILEILEFIADLLLKPQMPYQPSIMDTDLDLIFDVFGAFVAVIHVYVQRFYYKLKGI